MHSADLLKRALGLTGNDKPFCWQSELLSRFMNSNLPSALDIPTGLGKTAVMAIWLVARACGGRALPRRLVYVVDRRAVVDQATDEAIKLHQFVKSNLDVRQRLGLESNQELPVSTLRGQHIDNKNWLENPTHPAIVVGTVDMIGSRLLFEGYGVSRKMRPYHAAMLGVDTLVVLDEAHLVPPFESLMESIAKRQGCNEGQYDRLGAADANLEQIVPELRLLSLSATGRTSDGAFGLTEGDLQEGTVTRKRLDAKKRLKLHQIDDAAELVETLADKAWELCEEGSLATRILIFCNSRKDALDTRNEIRKRANNGKNASNDPDTIATDLFVGGRRVFERDRTAERLKTLGFIAGPNVAIERPTFLVATSAAEVGVDLDADHTVCDLVAWERMVQRLGRVNRRGDGEARVIVVEPPPSPTNNEKSAFKKDPGKRTKKDEENIEKYRKKVEVERKKWQPYREAIQLLPSANSVFDASPGAIRQLKMNANEHTLAILDQATTPPPLRPGLSRALVEAWSMTSLKEHTGRPIVAPWLRGWVDDKPQTAVVWRKHLPHRQELPDGKRAKQRYIRATEEFFEAAPPHLSEVLETETHRVLKWLENRAIALSTSENAAEASTGQSLGHERFFAIVLDNAGNVAVSNNQTGWLSIEDVIFHAPDETLPKSRINELRKKWENSFQSYLAGKTIVVDSRFAGLPDSGLLNDEWDDVPRTADDSINEDDIWNRDRDEPVIKYIVRNIGGDEAEPSGESESGVSDSDSNNRELAFDGTWKERVRFALDGDADTDNPPALVVYKWKGDSSIEDDRSTGFWQSLEGHQRQAEEYAKTIAQRLGLTDKYVAYANMLAVVARFHDQGKLASDWQRAFIQKAPIRPGELDGLPLAKTPGPIDFQILNHYRHELGSLLRIERNENGEYADFHALPEDLQELGMHLIVAHHGFARPLITTEGCADAPPSVLESQVQQIAIRFARLQKRWGPWGLAWWESLLRAADSQASRSASGKPVPATKKDT